MIVFEKIKWKNFLSTGQQGIEIDLNKDATGDVMITGAVGQVNTTNIADGAVTAAKLNSAVSLVLYNSSGVALKTLYGAGA